MRTTVTNTALILTNVVWAMRNGSIILPTIGDVYANRWIAADNRCQYADVTRRDTGYTHGGLSSQLWTTSFVLAEIYAVEPLEESHFSPK